MISIRELKQFPKEEFLKLTSCNEDLYNALQNSKEGFITVTRESDGRVEQGHTWAFGEGISCRMDNTSTWWCTSVIKKINWEEGYFDTLNSRYRFKFIEDKKKEKNEEKE